MGIGFEKNKYDFSGVLRGLQQAVNSAQELLEVQQLNSLNRFLDKDGKVLTKELSVSEDKVMSVPLLSLIPQNTLIMNSVEIEFDVRVESVNKKQTTNQELMSEVPNVELQVGIVGKKESGVMHVKVCFKSTETPEAISKIVDECNKTF